MFGMETGVSPMQSSPYNDLTQKLVFAGRSDVAKSKSLIWLTEPTIHAINNFVRCFMNYIF